MLFVLLFVVDFCEFIIYIPLFGHVIFSIFVPFLISLLVSVVFALLPSPCACVCLKSFDMSYRHISIIYLELASRDYSLINQLVLSRKI